VAKTEVLLCGTPQKTSIVRRMMSEMSLRLTLDTAGLAVLDDVRNLGVLFDKTLSGKDQVNSVVKQVLLKLRQLHYFSHLLAPSIKIKLLKSHVYCLSLSIYADSVFFCEIGVGLEMKLNKALNNCIRFIYLFFLFYFFFFNKQQSKRPRPKIIKQTSTPI
jgi:hypothetical protein